MFNLLYFLLYNKVIIHKYKSICVMATLFMMWFISAKCCIYTAIAVYLMLSCAGYSPLYCIGEVSGEDRYHAWVRIGTYNIEPSTLNLYHSATVDYQHPLITFNRTSDMITRVDMLSPIR